MKSNLQTKLAIAILLLATFSIYPTAGSEENTPQKVNCDVHVGPCSAAISGTSVSLDISPKPVKAMEDLVFTFTIHAKKNVADPYIDLGMPGMNMGRNRIILRPSGASIFQGKGVIVRCPSGRRTWKARITVPEMGSVEFIFDVIY